MTAKRLNIDLIEDLFVREELIHLYEENEQLRTKNNAYIQDIEVFKEENTHLKLENEQLKLLIKKVLETTPIAHSLAMELKNSVRELYD